MKRRKILPVLMCMLFAFTMFLNIDLKADAEEVTSGSCGAGVTWEYDGVDTLTISGNGAMNSFTGATPWNHLKEKVSKVVIEEGVTSVGWGSFKGFSNVTDVTLSNTVTTIGNAAFSGTNLSEIDIPSSVTTIDYYAFENNPNLTSLTIPENVTSVGTRFISGSGVKNLILKGNAVYNSEYIFEGCTTLKTVVIESGSLSGYRLFRDSEESLKSVTIGSGVTSISQGAFSSMTALETLTIEKGVCTEIGEEAFYNCKNLKEVVIPENIQTIGNFAFRGCTGLEKVTFFEGLETIGGKAFADCTSLKEAEIPLSVTKIGDYAFNGIVSAEEGKEESFVAGDYFLIRGYINTEAEKYASKRYFNCTFEPHAGNLAECTMSLSSSYFTYDGTAKEPTVTVKTPISGTVIPDTMYTKPVYANNVEVGKNASATVEGIGEWYGTLTKTFEIAGGNEPEEPEKPSNPTISEEEMMMMYEIMMKMGLIDSETTKFSPEQYEETIAMFAEFGYSRADAEYFMDYFGFWGGASADEGFGEEPVYRVSGENRYKTSYKAADVLKEQLGVEKFSSAVVVYGEKFPDALAGSYLAGKINAPILMIKEKYADELTDYINKNIEKNGKIYVLGGDTVIPESQLSGLQSYNVCRLAGKDRYVTNLRILEEAGVSNQDILVCTGKEFADSLSASATGKPILLLNNKRITEEQREFLENHKGNQYYIIGGTKAISAEMEEIIKQYGPTERIAGDNRYQTSVKLAEKFFENAEVAVLASAKNFPDGLCGGPLAMSKNAPLILTADGKEKVAVEFMNKNNIGIGAVLGGSKVIGDGTVESVFGVSDITIW